MKRIIFVLLMLGGIGIARGQELKKEKQIVINPDGISFSDGEKNIIIENNHSAKENIAIIVKNLKVSHQSKYLKIDSASNVLIVSDFVPGYTKTEKSAGSAYLLDLSYKIIIDVKDNKFKVNSPTIVIAANQKYESDAVIANKGVQFTIEMGIKGKRDIWNSKEKKMYIYDEKNKIIEKSTKAKLEKDLSILINIIVSQNDNANW